ncbi:hypothetical protein [Nocardia sp. CS682]|uniref:hypothetical protein n=1 Tax=Nocardia sp. CS682 TaxID=1047172 RepID=UPI001074C239|nr:hypothetical protein [Nocardia sp. CS682]QBS41222.1 hypothetical protein DMB37_14960 [Nocardia sp. CS682]
MRQTDGRAITNPENAQSFTHAEIKQAADEMNPAGLGSAFDAWSKIAAAVTNAGHQFETAIKQAVEQHWEGAAADNAVRGIRDYATRVGEFGETLNAQSTPLSQAASAAAKFKMSVPDVVDTSTNPRGAELRNSSEEQARDEMTTQYIQPYGTTAPAIPTLPPPINPISIPTPGGDSSIDPGTTPGTSTSPAENGSGTGDSGKQAATAETDNPTGTSTPETEPTSEETTPQAVSQEQGNNGAPTTPAATTTAASTPNSPITTPASTASPITAAFPTSTLPSTPTTVAAAANGTPSRTGTPSTSANPSTSASPRSEAQPGTSRPAPPATTTGAAGPQPAATPGRPGTPGVAGYPGMFPPGARSRGEDDDEHKSPGYLRTAEHAKELLGEREKTVPPVIGEK